MWNGCGISGHGTRAHESALMTFQRSERMRPIEKLEGEMDPLRRDESAPHLTPLTVMSLQHHTECRSPDCVHHPPSHARQTPLWLEQPRGRTGASWRSGKG